MKKLYRLVPFLSYLISFTENYLWIVILVLLTSSCESVPKKCQLEPYTIYKIVWIPCSDSVAYVFYDGSNREIKDTAGAYKLGDNIIKQTK